MSYRYIILILALLFDGEIIQGEAVSNTKISISYLSEKTNTTTRKVSKTNKYKTKRKVKKGEYSEEKEPNYPLVASIILLSAAIFWGLGGFIFNSLPLGFTLFFLAISSVFVAPAFFLLGLTLLIIGLVLRSKRRNKQRDKLTVKRAISKIYLKKGVIIRGTIIDQIPNTYIIIETLNGKQIRISDHEIEKVIQ